jgi:hypothetical protein
MLQRQQVLEGLRRLLPPKGKKDVARLLSVKLNYPNKCDTFSRSQEAVFELSMRFAEVNQLPAEMDEQIAVEKERLMFHELTQSPSAHFMPEFPHR